MLHQPAVLLFFFNDTATTEIYTLSLHDALPISAPPAPPRATPEPVVRLVPEEKTAPMAKPDLLRSEEHTSELQSPCNLVCRLLLEKKKNRIALTYLKNLVKVGYTDQSATHRAST